jgi:hypothetical protein
VCLLLCVLQLPALLSPGGHAFVVTVPENRPQGDRAGAGAVVPCCDTHATTSAHVLSLRADAVLAALQRSSACSRQRGCKVGGASAVRAYAGAGGGAAKPAQRLTRLTSCAPQCCCCCLSVLQPSSC